MPADDVIMPDDYRDLLAARGPGTLCGVLRLLAPGGPDGFNLEAEQRSLLGLGIERGFWPADAWADLEDDEDNHDLRAITSARLWGVFATGETCWWLPIADDPAGWLVLLAGHGWQQLNISTTGFLHRWAEGRLDLPVLSHGPVRRDWHLTPAGQPVTVPDGPEAGRDPLAQLATIVGPGHAEPVTYDWAAIETKTGRRLPPDYKRLHETYGAANPRADFLAWNGIFTSSPPRLKDIHDSYELSPDEEQRHRDRHAWFPAPEDLLFCGSTEGRDLLAWDTRDPDPARWPVLRITTAGVQAFVGTLTELYVAELTGTGPGLASFGPGNPATWAWPVWGPDAPPES
ncbi:MAG: SMI1/KNR4 family protein [Streptosporangiales bacterium]|nr:SMI1/KNR4 family protein [Streptosporangiales bacterium]